MQRAAILACLDLLFGCAGSRECWLSHHRGIALEGGIDLRDSIQHPLGELDGRHIARRDEPGDFLEALVVKRLSGAGTGTGGNRRRRRGAGTRLEGHKSTCTQQRESAAPRHQAIVGETC